MEIIKSVSDTEMPVFSVTGRIDSTSSGVLEKSLTDFISEEKKSFTLDIAGIEYVSSAGLRVLLGAHKKSAAAGISMTLTGVNKSIREVFDITGFSGILNIK
ncbi:MAG: STAS domain-containing protein [Defluviitaleaceae bacterium]|nr:STAS domain-containing protein [Defluviitaleaceae bacterium]